MFPMYSKPIHWIDLQSDSMVFMLGNIWLNKNNFSELGNVEITLKNSEDGITS